MRHTDCEVNSVFGTTAVARSSNTNINYGRENVYVYRQECEFAKSKHIQNYYTSIRGLQMLQRSLCTIRLTLMCCVSWLSFQSVCSLWCRLLTYDRSGRWTVLEPSGIWPRWKCFSGDQTGIFRARTWNYQSWMFSDAGYQPAGNGRYGKAARESCVCHKWFYTGQLGWLPVGRISGRCRRRWWRDIRIRLLWYNRYSETTSAQTLTLAAILTRANFRLQ